MVKAFHFSDPDFPFLCSLLLKFLVLYPCFFGVRSVVLSASDEPQRTWRGLRPQPKRPHRLLVGGESDFALRRKQGLTNAPTEFISVEAVTLHYGRQGAKCLPTTELVSVEAMIGHWAVDGE